MRSLEDYTEIVGDEAVWNLHKKASRLYKKHIVQVNSTSQGGGVAEILFRLVPLMNDIGVDTGWRVLHGNPNFFAVTKKIHNGLQGQETAFTEDEKDLYLHTNEYYSKYTHLKHDFVIIHDPQPLPIIKFFKKTQPWIWRCHIDLSHPDKELWNYIKKFILRYDMVILSNEQYKRPDLPVEQRIFLPAIDPVSYKNMELPKRIIERYIKEHGIPTDKPVITQISRFDKWKDPEGVVEVYKKVKENVDCRLILCGNTAGDDPECLEIFERVHDKVEDLVHKKEVILLTVEDNILVNVLQRISSVIIQKSLREGFGLTVTEAMWKGSPVVASNVGGIPLQITSGVDGFMFEPDDFDSFARKITELIRNPEHGKEIGKKARETVRKKFLITRLMNDYLDLINEVID